jgi:tripartite-type tricarboxylate transporter receptor subunit TctC
VRRALLFLAAALWACAVGAAETQAYPARPIRLIVPTSPSGASDALARLLGSELTRSWGQQVVVDNRPAGHGIVAMEMLARSPGDGYTLMLGNIGVIAINAGLYSNLPYDTLRDFAAVSLTTKQPFLLGINTTVPARDLREFIQLAKAKPGEVFFGSGGNGSGTHVSMEMFKQLVGIKLVHVPYKGGGPAINDVSAGQVQACMVGVSALMPHVRSGKVRALALSHRERLPMIRQVPTFAESGVPGFEISQWQGLIAPAKILPSALAAIHGETTRALETSKIADLLSRDGMEVVASTPKDFAVFIQIEIERWRKVIKTAGIRID